MRPILIFISAIFALATVSCEKAEVLKINGSSTVNPPVAEAASFLRSEEGMKIRVDIQGGSSGGISMLGEGLVHIGMTSKPVGEGDREKFPTTDFRSTRIGGDAVALVVSRDVYEGGITEVSRDQMQRIYERKAKNWKEFGGPDLPIVFFNKEPGRGTWSVFAKWLYGSADDAPPVSFPEVGANEEARNKVASTPGAITQLSYSWADRDQVFPLALQDGDVAIDPSAETIRTGAYPMSRPLFLLTDGDPNGDAKVFVDFMRGASGQELVKKHGYMSLAELGGVASAN